MNRSIRRLIESMPCLSLADFKRKIKVVENYLCKNHENPQVAQAFEDVIDVMGKFITPLLKDDKLRFEPYCYVYTQWLPRWNKLYPTLEEKVRESIAEVKTMRITTGASSILKMYLYNYYFLTKEERPKGVFTFENAKHHLDKVLPVEVDVKKITYGQVGLSYSDPDTGDFISKEVGVCFFYEFKSDWTHDVLLMKSLKDSMTADLEMKLKSLQKNYCAFIMIYSAKKKVVKIMPKTNVRFKSYKGSSFSLADEPWTERYGEIIMTRGANVYNFGGQGCFESLASK